MNIEEHDICECCNNATRDWKYRYKSNGAIKFIEICNNCHSLLIDVHFVDTEKHTYISSEKIERKTKSLRW